MTYVSFEDGTIHLLHQNIKITVDTVSLTSGSRIIGAAHEGNFAWPSVLLRDSELGLAVISAINNYEVGRLK